MTEEQPEKLAELDVEKADSYTTVNELEPEESDLSLVGPRTIWHKLASWGVETRGINPIPVSARRGTAYVNIFSLWFSMGLNLLPIITGMVGTLDYALSLRDCSLVIIFFTALCSIIPAYLSTLGPKTGLRQMIQARYTFGLYGVDVPVLLNMASITGFCVIGSVIGGQSLAAVTDGSLSWNVGIVIVAILALFLSFCGYKILHQYERYAWIPVLIAILIATGCGGKYLHLQVETEAPTASSVLTFGGLIAGFIIPYSGMASDFTTYMHPEVSSKRIFIYSFLGLYVPTVPLMILGAAIGGAVPNVPSWAAGYETGSAGGILAAMLTPAGGFGKFVTVVLAFSTLGNVAASLYSITLNFQILAPVLMRVPRAVFALITTAILIPVSIRAAVSFFASLENFIGVIAYWSAAYVALVLTEHLVFRKGAAASYEHAIFRDARALPTGIAALAAGALSFALVIPCMAQIWYTGPIAETTGDIGFEVAFFVSAILYVPFRALEIRIRGRL
ncbi:hypothetical protein PLICRDRAFT_33525 [Plicaturopsis crispa FD-325 SS-3]|nr:hypothetical protein PLICRDRAFT_33525 [Plicaturopsis crispa FD-325 SS-3]